MDSLSLLDSPLAISLPRLRRRLLAWFDQNQRILPWRHDRDPYRIWVSEVMLQQTQVASVIPYFTRFLDAFPTVFDLASAEEQTVLRLWEGLGYYRRARHLHQAARQVVDEHEGKFPDDPEWWAELPGVGRYILGAVLSQAFDRRLPIVEANSKRVLCRLFGVRGDPKSNTVINALWEHAETILPRQRCGDFNQALMELGALVCVPHVPRCEQCPLASICEAKRHGWQDSIPIRSVPKVIEEINEVAVIVRKGQQILLLQRPETGRWANLWEFPHDTMQASDTTEDTATRLVETMLGIRARVGPELLTIRHGVTRYRITLACREAIYRSGKVRLAYHVDARWFSREEFSAVPLSRPHRRLAENLDW